MNLKVNLKNSMCEGEKYNFFVPTMSNNFISSLNNNSPKPNKKGGSNGWVNLK